MLKHLKKLLVIALSLTALSAWSLHLGTPIKANITNQLIVAYQGPKLVLPSNLIQPLASVARAAGTSNQYHQELLFTRTIHSKQKSRPKMQHYYLLNFASQIEAEEAAEEIQNIPGVLWIQPNYLVEGDPREQRNDDVEEAVTPQGDQELYHQIIGSLDAWEVTEGENQVIAVTDDGFEQDHPELRNSFWKNLAEIENNGIDDDQNGFIDDFRGWNFSDYTPQIQEGKENHGTFVSGLISAARDQTGITGTAPRAKVMALKFIGGKIPWSSAQVARSYAYAIKNGARIINTSYNVDTMINDQLYLESVRYAYDAGALIFNSAGNSRDNQPERVMVHEILLVASTDTSNRYRDQRSYFSNYGRGIDLSAPGSDLISTIRQGLYEKNSGTSFSTPIVAAGAALVWSAYPDYNRNQVWSRLTALSKDIDPLHIPLYQGKMGSGRIDLKKALFEEVPPPQVRGFEQIKNAESIAPLNELQLNLKNVFTPEQSNFKNALTLYHFESGKFIVPRSVTPYRLGTNVIKFRFTEDLPNGNYLATLKAEVLLDPFGQHLDGNSDGIEGDDWSIQFKIEKFGKDIVYDE